MARSFKHSKEEILNEMKKILRELRRTPSSREFSKLSKFPLSTVIYRFGSFSNAIKLADGVVAEIKSYSDEEIITHFQELAATLGHAPLCHEYRENSLVCMQTIFRRFKSFRKLREMAGFHSTGNNPEITPEALLKDLELIIKEIGHIPTVEQYKEKGTYRYGNYSKYFGGLKWAVSLLAQKGRIPEGVLLGKTKYQS